MRKQAAVLLAMSMLTFAAGCRKEGPDRPKPNSEDRKQAMFTVRSARSMQSLREIGGAMYLYRKAHNGEPPSSLIQLVEEGLLKAENLVNPMSRRAPLKTDTNGLPAGPSTS